MGLEEEIKEANKSIVSEIKEANKSIVSKINDLSKDIVIREYQPLFDKVKNIALPHMREFRINEIKLNGSLLYFRYDGNFYNYNSGSNGEPIELSSLPIWYSSHSTIDLLPKFTRYHSEMNHILNDFKQTVQKSLASVLA